MIIAHRMEAEVTKGKDFEFHALFVKSMKPVR